MKVRDLAGGSGIYEANRQSEIASLGEMTLETRRVV